MKIDDKENEDNIKLNKVNKTMTYKEETNLLNNIEDIKEVIRSPTFKQLLKETHENNIMLKEIIKFINTYLSNHNNENDNDFFRNVLANLISNGIKLHK